SDTTTPTFKCIASDLEGFTDFLIRKNFQPMIAMKHGYFHKVKLCWFREIPHTMIIQRQKINTTSYTEEEYKQVNKNFNNFYTKLINPTTKSYYCDNLLKLISLDAPI